MGSLLYGLVGVLLGMWVSMLLQAMPAPFDDLVALTIPPERLNLYPGRTNGSAIPAQLTGAFERNEQLKGATRLFEGAVVGSESVAVTPSGVLVMIDRRGFIFRASKSGAGAYELHGSPLYIGPGRPLGFHVVGDDVLYVCDSLKGLLRVQLTSGSIEVVSNAISASRDASEGSPPIPINYANDLDVARDGTVYFTSCTDAPVARNALGFFDTMHSYLLSMLRGAADGQLLKWDPKTRETTVLMDGLAYANGVALSSDESWIAVVETNFARVHRYWLSGAKRGTTELLVDQLPGMADGISRSTDGGFWVGLVVPLTPLPGLLAPHRWARQLVSHVIKMLFPLVAKRWGAVVKLSASGQPEFALYDTDGSQVATVSAVTEHNGRLFLGNLGGDYVSYIDL